MLATLFLRSAWARCELLGVTPGASAATVDDLQRACVALAAAGCDRLLVREPLLGPVQVEALVEAVVPLFPIGGVLRNVTSLTPHVACYRSTPPAALADGSHQLGVDGWHEQVSRF